MCTGAPWRRYKKRFSRVAIQTSKTFYIICKVGYEMSGSGHWKTKHDENLAKDTGNKLHYTGEKYFRFRSQKATLGLVGTVFVKAP